MILPYYFVLANNNDELIEKPNSSLFNILIYYLAA